MLRFGPVDIPGFNNNTWGRDHNRVKARGIMAYSSEFLGLGFQTGRAEMLPHAGTRLAEGASRSV